ncbi:MAG: hypothetical protein QM656_05530 [Paracoccaceae bacterium]
MTALRKYQRLESLGLWRDGAEAQRREVVVGFREATLILSDPRTEMPLSHWSLPAIVRMNPGVLPAVYGPGAEPFESLELDDADMIAALETVRGAVARSRPRPGRLRGWMLGAGAGVIALLGVFWLPGALIARTAAMLPESTRAQIGQMALTDLTRVAGAPCATPLGTKALAKLSDRLFGTGAPQILVLRNGLRQGANLPGKVILLGRPVVESAKGPEAVAGFALAEDLRASHLDPVLPILRHAGLAATFRLLTTGALPEESVEGYGETLLRARPAALKDEALLERFKAAEVPSSPYAYALDPSGEAVLPLIEADPFAAAPGREILPDGDWISLQDICAG